MAPARLHLLLAFAILAAGCVGSTAETLGGTSDDRGDRVDDATVPGEIPKPGDIGRLAHEHDYWEGRERIVLYDGMVEPSLDEIMNATFFRLWWEKEPMIGGTGFNLPDGMIVYEGTGEMAITASWQDPRVTSLGFSFRSAENPDFSKAAPLESGKTHVIPVLPEMTDMPHMTTSRWSFVFSPSGPGAVLGPFHMRIEIVKTRDVALYPGHPEIFGDATELVIHEQAHEFSQVSYGRRIPNLLLTGAFGESEVTPQHVVPMDARWMRIEVNITRAESTPGQVVAIKFFLHGSNRAYLDYPYYKPIEGSLAEKRLVYELPVTMEMTDSPYATESQWRFFVEPTTSITGADGPCGGCTDTVMAYTMKITVYDHEREEASKTVNRGEG